MRGGKKDPKKNAKEDTISGVHGLLNLTLSYNLLGLRAIGAIGWRQRLYKSNNKILRENFFGAHAIARLTPAWLEGGAVLALQPITILKLRLAYRYRIQIPLFFSGGTFDTIEQAKSAFDPVKAHTEGEQVLRDRIQKVQDDNGGGRVLPASHILSADLTFRFKLKGILLLVNARYSKWFTGHGQTDKYKAFYEGGHDMIFSNEEDFFMIEGVTGYESGAFRYMVMVSYRNALNAGSEYFRIGPAFQWSIAPAWGWFKKPSLLVLANWYLAHNWRGRDFVPLIGARLGGEF
tara:strand:+ start:1416 stop:2288 length:873 start_codon:yes stop_codon:yes gene_type:complete